MKTLNIDVTSNFQALYDNPHQRIIILEGSSRSGKTYAVCQFIVHWCLTNKGKVVTIARDNLVVVKRTVYLDFVEILTTWRVKYKQNKSESTFDINGNLVRFVGLDDIHKVHGLKQDLLYVNEGLPISKDVYNQLLQRTTWQMIVDYNPSEVKHFLYDWAEKRPKTLLVKSTIFDNPKAPRESVRQILSYRPTPKNIAAGTANEYYWEVYGLGKRYKGNDVVIRAYKRYSKPLESHEFDWRFYGADFGFTDPTTFTEVTKLKGAKKLFLRVFMYHTGLTNDQIAEYILNNKEIDQSLPQIWDSAEPKSITELRTLGLTAIPASKGNSSIYFGIQKLQQYEIFVYQDPLSEHLANELENLRYLTDGNGDILKDSKGYPILKAGGDHCVDGVRYVLNKFPHL